MNSNNPTCMDDYDPESLDVKTARRKILSCINVVTDMEIISLADSIGRILAEDIIATIDVPGFRNSAMDGYAFRHSDSRDSLSFAIAGTSLAGHPYHGPIGSNQCVKVTTGAQVPDEMDTVVMQENTREGDARIEITQVPDAGSNIRAQGSNIKNQSVLMHRHARLGPAELGLAASVGLNEVTVLRKLSVACFSTGDELAPPGASLGAGMIHDSNRFMLLGLLNNPAIQVVDMGIVKDNENALRNCLERTHNTDMIISSGGVSVGEADFVKQALSEFGTVNFWKIAMKPGRPLTHAVLDSGAQFFGLPGNPVSGIVTFHHFVKPAIDAMIGQNYSPPFEQKAQLTSRLVKQPGRVELQRGILSQDAQGEWQVVSTGLQDSHVLTSMHRANCYIVLDIGSSGAETGELVNTLPFINF